jgi:hypothetical protein
MNRRQQLPEGPEVDDRASSNGWAQCATYYDPLYGDRRMPEWALRGERSPAHAPQRATGWLEVPPSDSV